MGVAIGSILGWGIACKILVSGAMPQPDTQNLILMTDLIVVPYLTRHRLHSVALSDPYLNASLYTQRVGHWPHAPTGHHPHPVSLSVLCPNGARHTSPGCNPGKRGSQSLAFCRNAAYPGMPRPCGRYAAFLQNAPILWGHTQGYTLGWYALPRWGRGVVFFG